MSLGKLARKLLGQKLFAVAGRVYRAVFVDLEIVAESVVPFIPKGAAVLDIGGGDGAPLNYILSLRSDITVTMVDLSPSVGTMIHNSFIERVRRYPQTSIRDYMAKGLPKPDVVMINDVLHHVAVPYRAQFFSDLGELLKQNPSIKLVVKDVEPGYFRTTLSYLADRYVSGDHTVCLISKKEVIEAVSPLFDTVKVQETPLFSRDCPNYSIVFTN